MQLARQIGLVLLFACYWAAQSHAQSAVRLYNEAQELYLQDNYSLAKEFAELAIKKHRVYPDAWFLLGQCEMQEGHTKKALKYYKKALKFTPGNLEYQYHQALAFEERGDHKQAVRNYLAITEKDARYGLAWKRLGKIFMGYGDPEQAIAYFGKAIDANALDKEAFWLRGNAATVAGQLPEARYDYSLVLQHDPKDIDAWFALANIELQMGNVVEAIKNYSMVVMFDSLHRDAHLNRGMALLALNMNADALKDFDAAIASDSMHFPSWLSRGHLLLEMEEYELAADNAMRAVEISPKSAEPWLMLGKAEFKMRRFMQAIMAFDQCLKYDGSIAEAYLIRGEAKRIMGLDKDACKDWRMVKKYDEGVLAEKAENWIIINCGN